LLFAAGLSAPANCAGRKDNEGPIALRSGREMKRDEIEKLREQVSCGAVLEKAGFAIDVKESTRRAIKFRRGSEIVIVTHEGRGWFDPLGDDKGDAFSLVMHLDHVNFADAFDFVAALVGFHPCEPLWRNPSPIALPDKPLVERWNGRRPPWPGSATWRYMSASRFLPTFVLRAAIARDLLREGPYGSMWAAHTDESGVVTGWEERGPDWRGFSTGGAKVLFRFGAAGASRLCVTEAAIDAKSLAAIEGIREGTLYLSTGGGWSPSTDYALRTLAARPGTLLIAATDANHQGDTYAERLRGLADEVGCGWQRLRPPANDWNEVLKQREKDKRDGKEERRGVPHARRPRQGRLRPAEPAR
jgi:hypothetical protein